MLAQIEADLHGHFSGNAAVLAICMYCTGHEGVRSLVFALRVAYSMYGLVPEFGGPTWLGCLGMASRTLELGPFCILLGFLRPSRHA